MHTLFIYPSSQKTIQDVKNVKKSPVVLMPGSHYIKYRGKKATTTIELELHIPMQNLLVCAVVPGALPCVKKMSESRQITKHLSVSAVGNNFSELDESIHLMRTPSKCLQLGHLLS